MVPTPSNGRTGQQARLFRVYNYYRIVISILLVGLLVLDTELLTTQPLTPIYFQTTALSYLALNIFTGLVLVTGYRVRPWHITVSVLVDIAILHLLALFSSGIGTGVANLVVISVAAGNILIPSRIGIFYAALATLSSLAVSSFLALSDVGAVDDIVRAGFMGVIYFATAFVLQNITRRLASSEQLATERARSIAQLEELNHQIIQRMHTGIIVADRGGAIRMANAASGELLLGERAASNQLEFLPQPLKLRLEQWTNDPAIRTQPFQARTHTPQVQANFTRLHDGLSDLILIFLEDTAKVTQQAQQMKLASLGRLTAGIAHEIRNPLGAISHAAQLLGESPSLDEGDRRMTGIIQRHSQRVNAIIENVLELSRRRSADVRLMDLGQWLARVVNEYRETSGQSVAIDLKLRKGPALARFDPSQMHQVLINLMDNGLRYSEKHTGTASLILSTGITEDGQRSYIDIQDQGPGLTEQQRGSLFEPFFTTEQSGTGLGLYLARELSEANQAQLTLLSNTSEGCCFRITFAHPERRISDYNEQAETTGVDA